MIIVPGPPALQETRHSRELGRRIEQVVREYQRDHPDASLSDVRTALAQLTPGGSQPDSARFRRVLGIGVGALLAGLFAALAAGGGRFETDTFALPIIGVTAAVAGIAIAIIRTVRRG